jgi:DNA-binding beta-propeller fold protein YncE
MKRKRDLVIGGTFVALIVLLGVGQAVLDNSAEAQVRPGMQVPKYEVDPLWPKPMPNNWVLGSAIGVSVDERDHVWIIHRPDTVSVTEAAQSTDPPSGECCTKAPPVLEFDPAGNLVGSWGGPGQGYEWPASNHGITVDHKGNVWIGGNGGTDSHILKFTKQGKFLAQFSNSGKCPAPGCSTSTEAFGRPAKIFVDPVANEAIIADGYLNKRVSIIDADTGKFKRFWGAYGNVPSDESTGNFNPDAPPIQQFRTPVHCAEMSKDGLIYVCDRPNNRLQVFTKEGKFVKEAWFARKSLGDGSTWDLVFSKDPQQKFIIMADGKNMRIYIILRDTLEVLTQFGDGGRQPGQFFAVHSLAIDSKSNLYTTETYEGKRLQKFVYKGLGPVTKFDQGTVWPTTSSSR